MKTILRRGAAALACLAALAPETRAQGAAPTPVSATTAPTASTSAMINLVRALVAKGTLSPAEGQVLLNQAEVEAARAQAAQVAAPRPGTVRVPYVPETVRAQIRDELKADVLQTAREEGWAKPGTVQNWVSQVKLFGDFRLRSQFNYFGRGNINDIIDFNQFNAGGPTEINPSQSSFAPPLLNTTTDRNNRTNFRLRFGLIAAIDDHIDLTVRLAGGDNNSPVSTSSTLGGGFTKKNIWIDQAFVNMRPLDGVVLTGGRMANPFYSNDIIWDVDLNFDGLVLAANSGERFGDRFKLSAVGGAFAFQYGADNFPTASQRKPRSTNQWIYAAQLVGDYQFRHDIGLKAGAAFYYFDNVQGRPSDPCQTYVTGTECSTDTQRPAFLQKGNTLFAIRNIVGPPGSVDFSQRQFVGLTFDYHILDLTADATVKLDDTKSVIVGGDYIKNLAFDRKALCKPFASLGGGTTTFGPPINNRSGTNGCAAAGNDPSFIGGDTAWEARIGVGYAEPRHWGEWNVTAIYKYIQSDAVLDSLNDNEFHLGGTNAQGYQLIGTLGLYDNAIARVRYLSANEIVGPPLAIDVLQLDFVVAF